MKKITHILLLVLWLFIIFSFSNESGTVSSSKSDSVTTKIIGDNDYFNGATKVIRKFAHLSEFAILTVLVYLTVSDYIIDKKYLYTLLFSYLFSVLDEIHQLFIPLRSGQFVDVCIDSLAIMITLSIIIKGTKKEV
jgi:VanZ family protein